MTHISVKSKVVTLDPHRVVSRSWPRTPFPLPASHPDLNLRALPKFLPYPAENKNETPENIKKTTSLCRNQPASAMPYTPRARIPSNLLVMRRNEGCIRVADRTRTRALFTFFLRLLSVLGFRPDA